MKKVKIIVLLAIALLSTSVFAQTSSAKKMTSKRQKTSTTTVIKNVRVFDGETLTKPTRVVIKDGYISAIGSAKAPRKSKVIDAKGKTLLPGYIDAHIHLNDRDNLKRAVRHGITTMMDMQPTSVELVDSLRNQPGLTDVKTSASVAVGPGGLLPKIVIIRDEDMIRSNDPQEGIRFVDRMAEKKAEYIKLILELPPATESMLTVEQVRPIVKRAHEMGMPVFAHTTTEEAWRTAIASGCDAQSLTPQVRPA